MATFSWRVVEDHAGDVVTSGTGTVRDTLTAEDVAVDLRGRYPHAVEVAVWQGRQVDRPDLVLAQLKEAVQRPSSGDTLKARERAFAGAVALDVFDPQQVA